MRRNQLWQTTAQNKFARVSTLFFVKLIHIVTLTVLIAVLLATSQGVQSQSPEIQTTEAKAEAKYRDELDKWMLRAYEGDAEAQFKVGVLFTNAQFGPPDFEQAVYWYTQSARQEHVLAQYNLGHQYLSGVGVSKSEESAMKWWLMAAKQDHALAQFNLGRAYFLGIGLTENHSQSKYWFKRAAANQEPKSIEILRQLGWYDGEQVATNNEYSVNSPALASGAKPVDADDGDLGLASKIVPIQTDEPSSNQTPAVAIESTTNEQKKIDTPVTTVPQTSTSLAKRPLATEKTGVGEVVLKNPLALYTNPSVRSVLISILDERDGITELARGNEWASIQLEYGFPVWVHSDFLMVSGSIGLVTGQAVNARSVPMILIGTVVGRLNKNEKVNVIDQSENWYRITAPKRFKVWVKIDELDRDPILINTDTQLRASQREWPSAQDQEVARTSPATIATTNSSSDSQLSDDNEWLFAQPDDNYTLQLASFDDPMKVEEFVAHATFANNAELHRFTASGKNVEWTYFLYGSYASRNTAESARNEIKQKLAWVRTFERLQQNRCLAWKTQLPTPQELNRYCNQ